MYKNKRVVCVIPARLASKRFPEKILATLLDKSLLQTVFEAACKCTIFDEVIIAVDDEKTLHIANKFAKNVVMTPPSCENGTQRLIFVKKIKNYSADIWVNWQADEPFINQEMIEALLSSQDDQIDVWTLKKEIKTDAELKDPNIVKVVTDKNGGALYFSRACIPFIRDQGATTIRYKHIGLYAFSKKAIDQIESLFSCELEEAENLEQLRFLYHGLKIHVGLTTRETIGIDLPEHLIAATTYLEKLAIH